MARDPDEDIPLVDKLHARLVSFLERNAPRIRGECDAATLKITIMYPQGDDDGTLYLESRVEEEVIVGEVSGRIPGVRWE